MRVLVWQWGRRGAGPRFAACLADALRGRPGVEVTLSLNRDAEIMRGECPPRCEMPVRTYGGMVSFLLRFVTAPFALPLLIARLRRFRPDLAICAMPGPLDLLMAAAVKLLGGRLVVIVHDAEPHLGDGFPMQMVLQRLLCRWADGLAALCGHVADRVRRQGLHRPLIPFEHPPFGFDIPAEARPPLRPRLGPPQEPLRLLCFGRLLPYKGLDLLAAALADCSGPLHVRVIGLGPESPALDALRACPGVTVENRWVPEQEIGEILAWSDALILPYREASQSGVAAAAIAAGRPVIATRVGGLREQLAGTPQAVLCDPDPASLARAIRLWMDTPPAAIAPVDATLAWRQAAEGLMQGIAAVLPRRISASFPPPIALRPLPPAA